MPSSSTRSAVTISMASEQWAADENQWKRESAWKPPGFGHRKPWETLSVSDVTDADTTKSADRSDSPNSQIHWVKASVASEPAQEPEEAEAEVSELREQLAAAEAKAASEEQKVASLNAKVELLMEQTALMSQADLMVKPALAKLSAEKEEKAAQCEALQSKFIDAMHEIGILAGKLANAEAASAAEADELREQLATAEGEMAGCELVTSMREATVTSLRAEMQGLSERAFLMVKAADLLKAEKEETARLMQEIAQLRRLTGIRMEPQQSGSV